MRGQLALSELREDERNPSAHRLATFEECATARKKQLFAVGANPGMDLTPVEINVRLVPGTARKTDLREVIPIPDKSQRVGKGEKLIESFNHGDKQAFERKTLFLRRCALLFNNGECSILVV
jgi:hypothetical protein